MSSVSPVVPFSSLSPPPLYCHLLPELDISPDHPWISVSFEELGFNGSRSNLLENNLLENERQDDLIYENEDIEYQKCLEYFDELDLKQEEVNMMIDESINRSNEELLYNKLIEEHLDQITFEKEKEKLVYEFQEYYNYQVEIWNQNCVTYEILNEWYEQLERDRSIECEKAYAEIEIMKNQEEEKNIQNQLKWEEMKHQCKINRLIKNASSDEDEGNVYMERNYRLYKGIR